MGRALAAALASTLCLAGCTLLVGTSAGAESQPSAPAHATGSVEARVVKVFPVVPSHLLGRHRSRQRRRAVVTVLGETSQSFEPNPSITVDQWMHVALDTVLDAAVAR